MTERDLRRNFTRAEVRRVWERQGRVCELCRRAIPFDLMHGDHIEPWSKGGQTTLENCQALCGSCNLRKGASSQAIAQQRFDAAKLRAGTPELRRWQEEAIASTIPAILDEPILIEACPGAGKTHFGLEVAYRLLVSGAISRVLVIVPSLAIADGWLANASRANRFAPTLPLLGPRSWRPVDPIMDQWVGAVATYQSLFSASDMYLAHATDPGERTLVIFDEVHHAGVESGWGEAAQESFARSASAVLCLTGTPFRTDRDHIVFVPNEDGAAKPHYSYGYGEAIEDEACRPVQFIHAKGETTFRTEDGQVHTVGFGDRLTEVGDRRRLRTALEIVGDGSIADLMLQSANDYLLDLRKRGDTDAAGLVVCVDCDHADSVASYMHESVTGTRPVVACSRLLDPSDPNPANAVNEFRTGHDPWIVAVNMVSEGVDIRRLRTVVYLTNRLTLLSFRQIVGRVVRTDKANIDDHGRVYIPADPSLVRMAAEITKETDHLPPPISIISDPKRKGHVIIESRGEKTTFAALSSVGGAVDASDSLGRAANSELIELASRYIELRGLTGTDAESLALAASENPELAESMRGVLDHREQ